MKFILAWIIKFQAKKLSQAEKAQEKSDFGRRFGWFVEKEGIKIAELDYVRWESESQFWHTYFIHWLVESDRQIKSEAEEWCNQKPVLRNRHFVDYTTSIFLTAHRRSNENMISLRFASVPLEYFEKELSGHK